MVQILARVTLASALLAAAAPAGAQSSGESPPRPASTGVYTEAQAERGRTVYRQECAECHASGFFTGEPFRMIWSGMPASMFFDVVRGSMPYDNPGGLEPEEYAAVLAYILELNGYPPGEDALPGTSEGLDRVILDEPPGDTP